MASHSIAFKIVVFYQIFMPRFDNLISETWAHEDRLDEGVLDISCLPKILANLWKMMGPKDPPGYDLKGYSGNRWLTRCLEKFPKIGKLGRTGFIESFLNENEIKSIWDTLFLKTEIGTVSIIESKFTEKRKISQIPGIKVIDILSEIYSVAYPGSEQGLPTEWLSDWIEWVVGDSQESHPPLRREDFLARFNFWFITRDLSLPHRLQMVGISRALPTAPSQFIDVPDFDIVKKFFLSSAFISKFDLSKFWRIFSSEEGLTFSVFRRRLNDCLKSDLIGSRIPREAGNLVWKLFPGSGRGRPIVDTPENVESKWAVTKAEIRDAVSDVWEVFRTVREEISENIPLDPPVQWISDFFLFAGEDVSADEDPVAESLEGTNFQVTTSALCVSQSVLTLWWISRGWGLPIPENMEISNPSEPVITTRCLSEAARIEEIVIYGNRSLGAVGGLRKLVRGMWRQLEEPRQLDEKKIPDFFRALWRALVPAADPPPLLIEQCVEGLQFRIQNFQGNTIDTRFNEEEFAFWVCISDSQVLSVFAKFSGNGQFLTKNETLALCEFFWRGGQKNREISRLQEAQHWAESLTEICSLWGNVNSLGSVVESSDTVPRGGISRSAFCELFPFWWLSRDFLNEVDANDPIREGSTSLVSRLTQLSKIFKYADIGKMGKIDKKTILDNVFPMSWSVLGGKKFPGPQWAARLGSRSGLLQGDEVPLESWQNFWASEIFIAESPGVRDVVLKWWSRGKDSKNESKDKLKRSGSWFSRKSVKVDGVSKLGRIQNLIKSVAQGIRGFGFVVDLGEWEKDFNECLEDVLECEKFDEFYPNFFLWLISTPRNHKEEKKIFNTVWDNLSFVDNMKDFKNICKRRFSSYIQSNDNNWESAFESWFSCLASFFDPKPTVIVSDHTEDIKDAAGDKKDADPEIKRVELKVAQNDAPPIQSEKQQPIDDEVKRVFVNRDSFDSIFPSEEETEQIWKSFSNESTGLINKQSLLELVKAVKIACGSAFSLKISAKNFLSLVNLSESSSKSKIDYKIFRAVFPIWFASQQTLKQDFKLIELWGKSEYHDRKDFQFFLTNLWMQNFGTNPQPVWWGPHISKRNFQGSLTCSKPFFLDNWMSDEEAITVFRGWAGDDGTFLSLRDEVPNLINVVISQGFSKDRATRALRDFLTLLDLAGLQENSKVVGLDDFKKVFPFWWAVHGNF